MAKKFYFGPHGYPMHNIVTRGWQSAPLVVCENGSVDLGDPGDFPGMEGYCSRGGNEFLVDYDGNEFLKRHCRLLTVYEGFDASVFDTSVEPVIEPWPDQIVQACSKADSLEDMAKTFAEAAGRAPNYLDDTQKVVLNQFIFGKIDAELAEIDARVEEYRKAHPDPEQLEDPDEGAPVNGREMVEGDL